MYLLKRLFLLDNILTRYRRDLNNYCHWTFDIIMTSTDTNKEKIPVSMYHHYQSKITINSMIKIKEMITKQNWQLHQYTYKVFKKGVNPQNIETYSSFCLGKISQCFKKWHLRCSWHPLLKTIPVMEKILVKQIGAVFRATWPITCFNNISQRPNCRRKTTTTTATHTVVEIKATWSE